MYTRNDTSVYTPFTWWDGPGDKKKIMEPLMWGECTPECQSRCTRSKTLIKEKVFTKVLCPYGFIQCYFCVFFLFNRFWNLVQQLLGISIWNNAEEQGIKTWKKGWVGNLWSYVFMCLFPIFNGKLCKCCLEIILCHWILSYSMIVSI